MRDGIAMFGSPAIVWGTAESIAPPDLQLDPGRALRDFLKAGLLVRHDTTVEPIPMPAGAYHMEAPWGIADGRGGAHVVWGAGSDTLRTAFPKTTSLRYARFDGARWTRPEAIVSAQSVDWGTSATTPIVREDTIHVAVSVFDAGGALVYARRTAQGWRTTRLSRGGFPRHVSMSVDDRGAVLLAFAASDPDARKANGHHLYVTRSDDGGLAWTAPMLVRSSGLGAAVHTRLIASNGGPLYLVWGQRREGAMFADSVLVATSVDGGRSWNTGRGLAVPGGLRNLEALIDGEGRLHVAGTAAAAAPAVVTADGEVAYARLLGDAWTRSAERIGFAASLPSLNLVSPDSLLLVWGVERPTKVQGIGAAEAPVAVLSLLSPLCPRERTGR